MAKVDSKAGESKVREFAKGVKAQFRRIIWPSKDTIWKQLAAVLTVSVIAGLLIVLIDFGSQKLIDYLLSI
ncbi:preprotein translocase subunit SecE [Lachnoclostridium sp. Marseille-P6806]|uniref:preprotein translocase subunit SecE n=1 Tax=Lachnoclostridium sp. Marseille-P6806 TaxID=2364793 RepID=UPI00102F61D5|nr:preprotein translocase subunit SecE [Lachnoclostridium sp. Marseille-P6806]